MGLVSEIAQTLRDRGTIAADAARQVAEAQSRGTLAQGQIWGGTLASLGQGIASIPAQQTQQVAQQQEQQLRGQQIQLGGLQIAGAQRQQAAQDALNGAYRNALNADGSIDLDKLRGSVLNSPAASEWPKIQEGLTAAQEKTLQVAKLRGEVASAERDQISSIANSADQASDPETKAAILLTHIASGMKTGAIAPEHGQPFINQILSETGTPDPAKVTNVINQMKQVSAPDVEKRAAAAKDLAEANRSGAAGLIKVTPGETVLDPVTRQPVYTAPSADAKPSAEQDDQRYRGIQAALLQKQPVTSADLAWAKGYEKQKTLGVDVTAGAAADRQAAAIRQQTAQQGRAQTFAEQQAGRKELTEKVEQPYQDAVEKASTLRSVIDAAKNGNMAAASVQGLLGTLGLVTTEGVKRINTTELNQVAGAGSLLERIKGQVGGLVAGKPLSPKLQDDLAQLSTMLEQSARQKYEAGFQQVTKRYQLDEPMLPAGGAGVAQAAASAAPAAPAGWKYVPKPGGGWTAVESK